jgi:glyoxylase-like metal-dependent hydrolase (beta-lactamase superfamily II)
LSAWRCWSARERHPHRSLRRLVNAVLVDEDDGPTLIDTTMNPGAAKAVLATAGETGRPIVRIALTHATRTTSASSTRWPPSCPASRS